MSFQPLGEIMTFRILLRALALLTYATLPASAASPFSFDTSQTELPKTSRPLAYRIDLDPNIEQLARMNEKEDADFKARMEVDLEVLRPTDKLILNAAFDLTFSGVSIDGMPLPPDSWLRDEAKPTRLTIRLPQELATGIHKLAIAYSGKIGRSPQGLYSSVYDKSAASGKRWMLVTHFEPGHARRMFPGWDEPVFKATFSLSVVLPRGFRAVSNMPILREEDLPGSGTDEHGRKKVTFANSPRMSTYLLSLVAGESGHLRQTIDGVDVGIIAPAPRIAQGRYALGESERLLRYYSNYFGTKYPLPKLDHVAVPNFAATAMENWGAITYINNALLYDDKLSTQATKEGIFEVVAHEIAHQWFGNLVTMAWWSDLWLNEGFANWMQKKATDDLNRDWKIRLRAHEEKEAVMDLDALGVAKPVERPVASAEAAESAFDAVTYQKGGHVIRMIEDTLGEELFRQGIREYLKLHAYSSASTGDLWAALKRAVGATRTSTGKEIDVAAIADGFIEHPGIPLIEFDQKCSGGKAKVTLTLGQFKLPGSSKAPQPRMPDWQVPVRVGRAGEASKLALVGKSADTVEFDGCDKPAKANFGDTGYYRVEYQSEHARKLGEKFWEFGPADRVNLLADSWAMVEAGAKPDSFFELVKKLPEERNQQIISGESLAMWTRMIATLLQIDDLMRGKPERAAFRNYATALIAPVYGRLGWDPGRHEATEAPANLLLRTLLIKTLGRFEHEDVKSKAQASFKSLRDGPESLHKELRESVATIAGYYAKPGEQSDFDYLHTLAKNASDTETKLLFYYALAGAHDPHLIERTVDIAATDENLPSGRINRLLALAARESDNPDRVWNLVLARRQEIMNKLSVSQRERLLPGIGRSSSSQEVADKLKELRREASEGAQYEIDKAVAVIEFKARFKERVVKPIHEWIIANPLN